MEKAKNSKKAKGKKKSNENEKEEPSVSNTNESSVNDEVEDLGKKRKIQDSEEKKPKRRLHAVHKNAWSDDIVNNGYARCIIATCNFISSDFAKMEQHFRACNGTPVYDENFCVNCENYMSSSNELLNHKNFCKGWSDSNKKRILYGQNTGKKLKKEPLVNNVETSIESCPDKLGESSNDDVAEFCPMYNKYISKEEFSSHLQICPAHDGSQREMEEEEEEEDRSIHYKTIQLKMKQTAIDKDVIVQPGPDIPEGQYFRRRSYTKQHKNSWKSTLEKTKYVKCIFRNCYFIAMSLEDMISHFGYCIGDGSFAKFNCPYCNGRVTSAEILDLHVERSHSHERALAGIEENDISEECSKPEDDNDGIHYGEMCEFGEANIRTSNEQPEESETADDILRRKTWENDLTVFGMAICRKGQCNFATTSLLEMKNHFNFCLGQVLNIPQGENHVKPLSIQEQKKRLRMYTKQRMKDLREAQGNSGTVLDLDEVYIPEPVKENLNKSGKTEKRGRWPRKSVQVVENPEKKYTGEVECGKCGFKGKYKSYHDHNNRKHTGLGWIKGEEPVDLNDEKELDRLVKEAFKMTKKGKCEICDDVKKSVKGFITHIQMCGKSEEEKKALKAVCPECSAKVLKYSLAQHMKMYHSPEELEKKKKKKSVPQESIDPNVRRQSAISAMSKFGDFLTDYDNEVQGANYILYKKSEPILPKLCNQLSNLWYKLHKEKKKIACRYPDCTFESEDVQDARHHHFTCSKLPDIVYMCESCDFYCEDEPTMQNHVANHRSCIRQKRIEAEVIIKEENNEEEVENFESFNDDSGLPSKKRKKYLSDSVKPNMEEELRMKQLFCRRQNMDNVRGLNFYFSGLKMTLNEELSEECKNETWPELVTKNEDWCQIPADICEKFFPELTESISVHFTNDAKEDIKWKRFKRFEGDLIEDVPVMFVGASIRSMSWCKVSSKRMKDNACRQFLAVATAKGFDYMTNIQERSTPLKSTILQIWDCGFLDNSPAVEPPKLALGILHDTGEIWDLSWFPEDTFFPGTDETLPRIGLLATASEDGFVRVWSICDPAHLKNISGLPIFKINPIIKFVVDQDLHDNCLRVAVGRNGVIAGGYGNGVLAVWSVKNVSSPFTKKEENTSIIKANLIIQAHRTSITALTFRPNSNRYVSSGALDRVSKLWDLESPMLPIEQLTKETCLDNIWTRNWPMMIYNFDDVFVVGNKGLSKFIKNALGDKSLSCLIMDNMCVNVSFSDWLNALCGCSNAGEVKVRLLKNFIYDQKIYEKTQTTISSVILEKLSNKKVGDTPDTNDTVSEDILFQGDINKTYNNITSTYGMVIKDNEEKSKIKIKKTQIHPEEFPIRAVNKVCFNPNFKSFGHIAVGYNCGFIRIQYLKEIQNEKNLKTFLES